MNDAVKRQAEQRLKEFAEHGLDDKNKSLDPKNKEKHEPEEKEKFEHEGQVGGALGAGLGGTPGSDGD